MSISSAAASSPTLARAEARPVVRQQPRRHLVRDAIPAFIILLAFVPALVEHGINLWGKAHYQFFPLVLIGSGLLGYFNVRRLGPLRPGKYKILSYGGAFVALLGLAAGSVLTSSLLSVVSFLVCMLAFIYGYGGWPLLKALLPAWLFLWLAVPPPFNWDLKLIIYLQQLTAQWSDVVLDVAHITHVMSGNVVEVPGQRLLVEEACSGIHSLFAVLTCSLFFVFWSRRPVLHAILLILGGVGWVLAANVARVVGVAVAWTRFDHLDLAHGWKHETLGFVIFGFLLVLVWSLDRLLCFLFSSTYSFIALFRKGRLLLAKTLEAKNRAPDPGATRWPSFAGTWVYSIPFVALFGLLAMGNVALAALGLIDISGAADAPLVSAMARLGENSMPPQPKLGDVVALRVGYKPEERERDDQNGEHSRTWMYKQGSYDSQVSVDYTFRIWHDLTVCYVTNGWTILSSNTVAQTAPDGTPEVFVDATMTKPFSQHGHLMFTMIGVDGRLAQPPAASEGFLRDRLKRFRDAVERRPSPLVYQVQLLTTAYTPLSEEQKARDREFFKIARGIAQQYAPFRGQPQQQQTPQGGGQ